MKSFFQFLRNYILPLVCGCIVFAALITACKLCNGFTAGGSWHYDAQLLSVGDWLPVFIVLSALLGVLPCVVYNGIQDMNASREVNQVAEPLFCVPCVMPVLFAHGLTVGQYVEVDGKQYRVKALKLA